MSDRHDRSNDCPHCRRDVDRGEDWEKEVDDEVGQGHHYWENVVESLPHEETATRTYQLTNLQTDLYGGGPPRQLSP